MYVHTHVRYTRIVGAGASVLLGAFTGPAAASTWLDQGGSGDTYGGISLTPAETAALAASPIPDLADRMRAAVEETVDHGGNVAIWFYKETKRAAANHLYAVMVQQWPEAG